MQKEENPKKLRVFFLQPEPGKGKPQDGTGGAASWASSSYTDLPDEDQGEWDTTPQPASILGSPPGSPILNSPAKARMRMDPYLQTSGTVSTTEHPDQIGLNLQSSIAAFPTSGQPILNTTMKDMLLSLQSSLMANFSSLIHKFTSEMQCVGERVQYIENRMDECTTTVNDLIDAYKDQSDDNDWIKAKLEDCEDRSRRNNVKIRRVPESIPPSDLHKYASDMISNLLSEVPPIERTIGRIHRIPKPKYLDTSIPRDILMKINFFPIKQQLLAKARSIPDLPAPNNGVQLYAVLSQNTLNLRRQMKMITKALNNHKIPYN